MDKLKVEKLKKFGFEFLSIFIGVFAAFALDNWNEHRKDQKTEIEILHEIKNGLSQDIKDIDINEQGHKAGLDASVYFKNLLLNKQKNQDSLAYYYFTLFRSFVSEQNRSGYETLKSKGLSLIENDSLRSQIISLYENDYNSIRKLEEDYSELQFHENYFKEFNHILSPHFMINESGNVAGINQHLQLTKTEKNILIIDLGKIYINRVFMLKSYASLKNKITTLQKNIEKEINR